MTLRKDSREFDRFGGNMSCRECSYFQDFQEKILWFKNDEYVFECPVTKSYQLSWHDFDCPHFTPDQPEGHPVFDLRPQGRARKHHA
jgi:hypothetical protein